MKSGTRRIGLFIAMLFATVLMAPSVASAVDAPPVGTPGATTMEITGGFLKVGGTLEAPLSEEDLPTRPTFDATVGADGSLFVPKSGFHFPHMVFPVEDVPIIGDLDIGIDIIPTHDVTGTINPESGAVDIFMRFKIKATTSGLADVGSNCTIGTDAAPLTLNMSTSTGVDPSATPGLSLGGIPYNADTGTARVADKSFTAPAHTGCTGLAAGQINSLLGLPSPAGSNSGEFSLAFTPKVLPAVEVRYTASDIDGKIPFPVDFDATNSVSRIGAITEYRWDFDGDGTADQTTNGPTVTHNYTVAGVYQTKLTVVTANGELTRSRATVTAKSIDVTFTDKAPISSTNRSPHFAFTSNEEGATFECRFDVGATEGTFEPCTSPVDYTDLVDNDYKLLVRASVGSDTGLPAVAPFRVDNINPVATITGQPNNPIGANTTTGVVSFQADEQVTFECRYTPTAAPVEPVEGEEPPPGPQFEPCSSPKDVAWQAIEGTNTFEVRPTDLAGNVGNVVTATWVVDTTPPVTTINSGPPNPTNAVGGAYSEACDGDTLTCILDALSGGSLTKERSTTGNVAQSFGFTANEAGSTFICQFNDGPERACITGVQTGLGVSGANNSFTFDEKLRRLGTPVQGTNTLRVWATDAVGNRAPTPTVRTFVYDSIAPVITSLAKPAEFTKTTQNTVIFQSNEPVVTFECRTVNNTGTGTTAFATGTGAPSGFAACNPGLLNSTLGWYTAVGQTDGRKGVQVRATDPAGNVLNTNNNVLNNGGLTVYWTVDNALPTNSFAAGSQQEGSYTTSPNATINLAAADTPINFGTTANGITAQQPTYECSLNNAPTFTPCTTPYQVTGQAPGAKSLRVQVKDAAGNLSAAPIERKWTVVGAANQSVTLNTTPAAVSGVRDNTYTFSPDNGTAECRIDPTEANNSAGTGWTACTSPKTFTGLADGNHQVEIRSAAGQVPAVHNFAVYANLPTVTVGGLPGIDRSGTRYTGLSQDAASITFTAPANPVFAPGATTFQCRYFETTAATPPFEPCTSPYQVNWNKLNDGKTMRFEVQPISSTGNNGSISTSNWTIVSTNPAVAFGKPAVTTACFNGALNGPGSAGCVATADSTQPGLRSSVAAPRFHATTSKPISTAIAFACQLNGGTIQNPCTARTSTINANTLTVLLATSRGNNDNFGTAPTANATNTFKIWAVDLGGNQSDPIEYTWVQDTTAPGFAITSPIPARTNAGTVEKPLNVDIVANEDLNSPVGAVCRLIPNGTAGGAGTSPGANPTVALGAGWASCGTASDARHVTYSNTTLAEGTYALDIRGYDRGWNVAVGTTTALRPTETDNNVNGRRYVFIVDRTAPTTNITGGPAEAATVGQKAASFTFTTSEPASTAGSECRIDPADPEDLEGGWAPCSSPYEVADLADGEHKVQIRSWDTAGNYAVAPATRTWTIDSTPPGIELKSSVEGDLTNETSIVLGQLTDPADATVECRLLTPADLRVPGEGEEPPADVAWGSACGTVIVPEEPPVEEPPAEDPPAEDPPAEDPPAEDPDPFRYLTYENLTDGDYRFEIRATNGLGVLSDATSFAWTVDTEAPDVEITSGPNAATKATTAEFAFSSTDESAEFECAIDGGTAEACESPVSYDELGNGDHTVTVTATDEAGNVSDPGASRTWSVDTVNPIASYTSGPTGTVNVANASFAFSSDKAGSTFECKLDSGDWAACTSPKAVSGLANGSHTISVRATDTLGNLGAGIDRTWTVNVPDPPDPLCEDTGKVGVYPDCYEPCTAEQIGTPPNCLDPCPVGTSGTPPNCVPDEVLAADLARVTVKGPKKAKRGKQFVVRAQVKNNGDAAATNVKVCLKTPKRLIAGKASRCVTIKSIAAGATGTATFKVKGKKAAKKAKKAAKMTITAPMGDGLATGKRIYKPILIG